VGSVGFQPLQLDEVRTRFRKMGDPELIRLGRAAAGLFRTEDQLAIRRVTCSWTNFTGRAPNGGAGIPGRIAKCSLRVSEDGYDSGADSVSDAIGSPADSSTNF
jgi:hypothetical protein